MDLSLGMGSDAYTSVIAHELQHLIHFNGNPREDVWVNEGVSVVSGDLAGQSDDFRDSFLKTPDTQLNVWNLNGDNYAHYGAAGLFFRYLALRSGGASALHDLVFETGKGISGIEDFLRKHDEPSFDDLFADWTVANYTGGPQGYLTADQRVATTATLDGPKSARRDGAAVRGRTTSKSTCRDNRGRSPSTARRRCPCYPTSPTAAAASGGPGAATTSTRR